MKPARRLVVAVLSVAAVLIGGAIAALIVLRSNRSAGVPPGLVPASWAEYRTSLGHRAHVDATKAVCRDCHDYERNGFKNPGTAPCQRCHAKQAARTHAGSVESKTDCLHCHVFAPERAAPVCIGCHERPQGRLAAIAQHAKQDCANCHRIHEERAVAGSDCFGCHDERAPGHAEHAGSKDCLDCHGGHTPAHAAVARCSSCHMQPAGPRPAGHENCVGCHQPHDFAARGEQACTRCHGVKPTLLAAQVALHAVCTSCHTPHAPAQAVDSCAGCHAGIQVAHGSKGACVQCHAPHGGDSNAKASPCTSCHGDIAQSDTSAHAAGTACQMCHGPHGFSRIDRPALCATCHAREVTLAAANVGHAGCGSCHGASLPHAPARSPPCASCHAKEQATAPAGHAKCDSCHESHSARVTVSAACASCHANKTGGPHGAVKGGCATCHRPHGPGGVASSPVCASCHARDGLPALHLVTGHTNCDRCHDSHNAPRSDRRTCTGNCHTDKRAHQQDSQVCGGCHVFRR